MLSFNTTLVKVLFILEDLIKTDLYGFNTTLVKVLYGSLFAIKERIKVSIQLLLRFYHHKIGI